MIDLKTTKTHTTADNNTIESILGDAFEQATDAFITNTHETISRKEHSEIIELVINCPQHQLDDYQDDFHNELKNQLAKQLKLNNDEYIQFGNVNHLYNIGNNCQYPIQIVTKDEIINFGRLNSNTDIYCNIKHISVADNNGQGLNNKRIELHASYRI